VWCLRTHPAGQTDLARLATQQGLGYAFPVLAQKLACAVYPRCQRDTAFEPQMWFERLPGAERVRLTSHGTSTGCALRGCAAMTVGRRRERPRA
jgi:hypothetical protein